MNKQQFNEALCFIDADLVEGYIRQDDALKKSAVKKNMWLRVGAVAACFCVMVAAVFALPMMLRDDSPPVVVEDTTSSDTPIDTAPPADTTAPIVITDPNTPPKAPILDDHGIINGTASATIGNISLSEGEWKDYAGNPGFHAQTVIEAKVIEILPNIYLYPGANKTYRIARLEIIDTIRGEGLPKEIYYRYSYYDEHLFDGYDSLIFSLEQIGIENYVMVNKTQGKIEYFPHMFETCYVDDPGYGSVIAFTNGIIDTSLWRRATHLLPPVDGMYLIEHILIKEQDPINRNNRYYAADIGDTVEQVKTNILEACANEDSNFSMFDVIRNTPDYVTAEDVFLSDSQKALWNYVSPDNKNVFCHTLTVGVYYRVSIEYTRVIHGCLTNEVISTSGGIGRHGFVENRADDNPDRYDNYTAEDLSRVPNIAFVIDQLDLAALIPPHITLDEKTILRGCEALGWYRNIDGKIYGIVRIHWVYDYNNENGSNMYIQDDMYYLYDADGNGCIIEREELKSIIVKDSNIMSFKYEPQYEPWI